MLLRIRLQLIVLISVLGLFYHQAWCNPKASTEHLLKDLAVAGTLGVWLFSALRDDTQLQDTQQTWLSLSQGRFYANETADQAQALYRIQLHQLGVNSRSQWLDGDTWQMQIHWETTLSYWQLQDYLPYFDKHTSNTQGWALSWTPVFVTQWHDLAPIYVELGIGPTWLTSQQFGTLAKSSHFQFNDILGIGWISKDWQLGYRFIHWSNGGLALPNPRTDFHQIQLQWRLPINP